MYLCETVLIFAVAIAYTRAFLKFLVELFFFLFLLSRILFWRYFSVGNEGGDHPPGDLRRDPCHVRRRRRAREDLHIFN